MWPKRMLKNAHLVVLWTCSRWVTAVGKQSSCDVIKEGMSWGGINSLLGRERISLCSTMKSTVFMEMCDLY